MKTHMTEFVVLIIIVSILFIPISVNAKSSNEVSFPELPTGGNVEDIWPSSSCLSQYHRVYELYRAGKFDEGYAFMPNLVSQILVLGPEDIMTEGDEATISFYISYRLMPTLAMLRVIWDTNRKHADDMTKKGLVDKSESMHVVNLMLSSQLIHAKPRSMLSLIQGHTLWKCSWQSIIDLKLVAKQSGDLTVPRKCVKRSAFYSDYYLKPIVKHNSDVWEDAENLTNGMDEATKEEYLSDRALIQQKAEAAEIDVLIGIWDRYVNIDDCKRLLRSKTLN